MLLLSGDAKNKQQQQRAQCTVIIIIITTNSGMLRCLLFRFIAITLGQREFYSNALRR